MINTIVRGIPSTLGPVDVDGKPNMMKYLVRSYDSGGGEYVTSVWRLKEAANDFWWAEGKPEYAHLIKDDVKEDFMFEVYPNDSYTRGTTYIWNTNQKEIGALHQQVCFEIINGNYWDSEWAFP